MVAGISSSQSNNPWLLWQNKQVGQQEKPVAYVLKPGEETEQFQAPKVEPTNKYLFVNPSIGVTPAPEVNNQYGISIPQNHSYTTDETGTKVALGQDGVGLAHKNPNEYKFHLIA